MDLQLPLSDSNRITQAEVYVIAMENEKAGICLVSTLSSNQHQILFSIIFHIFKLFHRYSFHSIHFLGTTCVLCAFPFIFSPCINCVNMQKWVQMLYYCVFIVIFQFGWAAVQISHLSLIPELTPNEHDRTRLTAIR